MIIRLRILNLNMYLIFKESKCKGLNLVETVLEIIRVRIVFLKSESVYSSRFEN